MNLLEKHCLLYSDGNNFRHGSLLPVGKLQVYHNFCLCSLVHTSQSEDKYYIMGWGSSYELRNQTVGPPKSGTLLHYQCDSRVHGNTAICCAKHGSKTNTPFYTLPAYLSLICTVVNRHPP